MDALAAESQRLLQASLAQSSQGTYRNCVNKFNKFRFDHGLDQTWPAALQAITMFIAFLSLARYAPSTIFTHIAALSFVHKINSWPDPTQSFVIKKLREGLKRQGHRADRRQPITYQLLGRLVNILPSICNSVYETSLFRAAFLLAFFGFLRVGEFTSPTKRADTSHLILFSDVFFTEGGMRVNIRYSKTDQRGRSTPLFFQGSSNPHLCPVRAVSHFLQLRSPRDGPLFTHFNGDPLTRYQFGHVLKKCVSVIGLSPDVYGPHSFRIGAATSAAMCGLSDNDIQALGRWRSSAFKLYIRPCQFDSLF